jgi:hypothetical protein
VAILACAAPVSAAVAVDADTITTSMSDSVGPVDNSGATAATVAVDDAAADDDDGRSADGDKSTATPVTEASASSETIGGCCGCCFCLIKAFKVPASEPFAAAADDDDGGAANRTSGGGAETLAPAAELP